MKKVTKTQALRVGNKLGIDFDVVSVDTLKQGINIEMEHSNITHGSILMSAKIACAHLEEFPDYYQELEKMESKLNKRWKGKKKPDIYL